MDRAEFLEAFETNIQCIDKGSEYLFTIYEDAETTPVQYDSVPYDPRAVYEGPSYLIRFIKRCREEGIEPLLYYAPFDAVITVDYVTSISEALEVPYLDLYKQRDSVVNNKTDYADRAHLNFAGEIKTTELLGNALLANFSFEEHSSSETARWNRYDSEYIEYITGLIVNAEDLKETVLLLADDNFTAEIILPKRIDRHIGILFDELKDTCQIRMDDSTDRVTMNVFDSHSNKLIAQKTFSVPLNWKEVHLSELYQQEHAYVTIEGVFDGNEKSPWKVTGLLPAAEYRDGILNYNEPWNSVSSNVYKVGLFDSNGSFLGGYPSAEETTKTVILSDAIDLFNGTEYIVISGIDGSVKMDGWISFPVQ
jgi:hypothetical protein